MTEDDSCRLTYKEGRKIRMEAGRPYMRAALAGLAPASILAIAMLLTGMIDGTLPGRPEHLEVLLASGDVSPALYDYLKEQAKSYVPVLAGTLFGGMGTVFAMMILGNHVSSAALKKANDEKKPPEEPRGYRTEEEYRSRKVLTLDWYRRRMRHSGQSPRGQHIGTEQSRDVTVQKRLSPHARHV